MVTFLKTTYHIAASGKSFNTYQDAQRWLDSRTLTPKVGSPGPSLVSPGSTPRSPRSSSYPSNSRHDNLQKSSRYVDIGIQCESLHSHDVHPPNVPVTTLSTKLVPVRPRAKEVHGMQVGVKLSGEQLAVLNMVDTGYNVFFTGPAGTHTNRISDGMKLTFSK
ncbi:hypothetical protein BDQ17DRAFT_45321 [Cyathus striatus]|nr:hypothetical protein BDQ17DRAFT_45321 [Cyathus striatus]